MGTIVEVELPESLEPAQGYEVDKVKLVFQALRADGKGEDVYPVLKITYKKKRYKPKYGENYALIGSYSNVIIYVWDNNEGDRARLEDGNCFHIDDKEGINAAIERVKKAYIGDS